MNAQSDEMDPDDLEPLLDDGFDDEELEEWVDDEDADVQIAVGPAAEDEFDIRVTITVGEMEKSAVCDAVRGPLDQRVPEMAAACRWKRVVVEFVGDAMVPSAIKELVATSFGDVCPESVTVQRGYPDEVVLTNDKPSLDVSTAELPAGGGTRVAVNAGELTASDLAGLLPAEIEKLCASAKDRSFVFDFQGATAPSAAIYSEPLRVAGASRVALLVDGDEHVEFDRQLDELVAVSLDGDQATVEIKDGADEATTLRALDHALGQAASAVAGKAVSVQLPAGLSRSAAIGALAGAAASLEPASLELSDGERLWPPLLRVGSKGSRTSLRFRDGVRPDMMAQLERELDGVTIVGQEVDLDWPVDAAADAAVRACLIAAGPASVVFTFGGENAELVHPEVIAFREDGERLVCEVETSHGKPAHLVPLIRRALADRDLSGRKVDIEVKGSGVVSRSMREAILTGLESGGVARGRLIDQGETEFLLPALFAFDPVGDNDFRVTAHPGDRTDQQVEAATRNELEAREFSSETTVRVADASLVATFVERGVGRVLLDGEQSVLVHPPLLAVERDGAAVRIQASPTEDDDGLGRQLARELPGVRAVIGDLTTAEVTLLWPGSAAARTKLVDELLAGSPAVLRVDDGSGVKQLHPEVVRTFVDVLGRRPNVDPPLLMLGIDLDDLEGATTALANHAAEAASSRVLVVYRQDSREVAGPTDHPVVQATRKTLEAAAKAVLQFRPGVGGTPAHFEVVSSSLEGLAVGGRMKDPRGAR